jgi:hypothetical protein
MNLDELLSEIDEEEFFKLEEIFKERVLSQYFEESSQISLSIKLVSKSKTEFFISLRMFFQDNDTDEPLSIDDAGPLNPEDLDEEDLISGNFEILGDAVTEDINNLSDSGDIELPEEIRNALLGEDSSYEFYGVRYWWNDKELDY